jgi:hypothetical protein
MMHLSKQDRANLIKNTQEKYIILTKNTKKLLRVTNLFIFKNNLYLRTLFNN